MQHSGQKPIVDVFAENISVYFNIINAGLNCIVYSAPGRFFLSWYSLPDIVFELRYQSTPLHNVLPVRLTQGAPSIPLKKNQNHYPKADRSGL